MKQFVDGSDQAFAELLQRASGACIRFRQQPMPPGSQPLVADVGFERDAVSGQIRLCVTPVRPGQAAGPEVRDWLASGTRDFGNPGDLLTWIRGPLAQAFAPATTPLSADVALTDMDAVRAGLEEQKQAIYIDAGTLSARMQEKIRGQDGAIQTLSAAVARHLARRHPSRPAVLFAVGPSGVGKTRSAERLAEVLSDIDGAEGEYRYLRLDMSEYQEAHRVSQLLGAPQGYVGYGEGSQLLDSLAEHPRTIVLFDEIEKAHPSILRVLMNAMDQGRLSSASGSGAGREVDCRSAIFLFTSNLRAEGIVEELTRRHGFGTSMIEDEVCRSALLAAGLAPEIIGRIARFLVYQTLDSETRAQIVADAIVEVAAEYGVALSRVSPFSVIEVMKKARGRSFGARPERYFIDELYGAVLAAAGGKGVTGPLALIGPPYAVVSASDSDPEGAP